MRISEFDASLDRPRHSIIREGCDVSKLLVGESRECSAALSELLTRARSAVPGLTADALPADVSPDR
jgi:hypothetical protein